MTKKFRFMTGLLAVVLAFVMLSSVAYIAAESDHDCTGVDCAICHQINVCENLLKSIGLAGSAAAAVAAILYSVPDHSLLYRGCPYLYAGFSQGQTFRLKIRTFYKGVVYLFSDRLLQRCCYPCIFAPIFKFLS